MKLIYILCYNYQSIYKIKYKWPLNSTQEIHDSLLGSLLFFSSNYEFCTRDTLTNSAKNVKNR